MNTNEQRLLQAQKMEAVGRLACGIAHDFNNLLTAITGYSELVITNLAVTDPMIQDVYEIRRAALSAARLTKQLLAFGSHQRARAEVLDLNAIVARATGILRRTLGENVGVTLALDPDIPRIKADAGQLEQVVVNLAVNARDAMPNGGHLTLTTSRYAGDRDPAIGCAREYVRLTIADTGCGIPAETRSKVFEPFFTTKGAAGTGLGLATVYGIVTQSGGQIDVDSTIGIGTTFTIDLPATSEAPVADLSAPPPVFVDGYARVLIVEDDPCVRQIVELVLRRAGHDVVAVESPQEALAALRSQPDINLVLTDVVMPEMNGYDLAAEAKKIAPNARIVFMSGYAHDPDRQPPDDAFLAKPFTAESLTHVVQHALARAS